MMTLLNDDSFGSSLDVSLSVNMTSIRQFVECLYKY